MSGVADGGLEHRPRAARRADRSGSSEGLRAARRALATARRSPAQASPTGPARRRAGCPPPRASLVASRTSSELKQARYRSATQRPRAAALVRAAGTAAGAAVLGGAGLEVHAGATARGLARLGAGARRSPSLPPSGVVQTCAPAQALPQAPQCRDRSRGRRRRRSSRRARRGRGTGPPSRSPRAAGLAANAAVAAGPSPRPCRYRPQSIRSRGAGLLLVTGREPEGEASERDEEQAKVRVMDSFRCCAGTQRHEDRASGEGVAEAVLGGPAVEEVPNLEVEADPRRAACAPTRQPRP